jgi:ammonia channel protein AmtB
LDAAPEFAPVALVGGLVRLPCRLGGRRGIASGAVAGLVAITPASGFVGPTPAVIIGAVAGVITDDQEREGLDLSQHGERIE